MYLEFPIPLYRLAVGLPTLFTPRLYHKIILLNFGDVISLLPQNVVLWTIESSYLTSYLTLIHFIVHVPRDFSIYILLLSKLHQISYQKRILETSLFPDQVWKFNSSNACINKYLEQVQIL